MAADDELSGPLKETLEQMRDAAWPAALEQKIIARGVAAGPAGRFFRGWLWAIAAVVGVLIAAGGAYYVLLHRGGGSPEEMPKVAIGEPSGIAPATQQVEPAPATLAMGGGRGADRGMGDGGDRGAGSMGLRGGTRGLGATPLAGYVVVAAEAPVIVATGPGEPVRLGVTAAADISGALHVWDWTKPGAESRVWKVGIGQGIRPMGVSADGKWVALSDGRVVSTETGDDQRVANLLEGAERLRGVYFSPDGSCVLLFVTIEVNAIIGTVRVLDFPSGKKRFEIANQSIAVVACTFTPDSKQFLVMDGKQTIHRWDAATGRELAAYEPAFSNSIRGIAVSPDGKMLAAASARNENYLWELGTGKLLYKLTVKQSIVTYEASGVRMLAFSPDGKTLAAAGLSNAFFWSTETGQPGVVLPSGTGGGSQLRFAPDGKKMFIITDFRSSGRNNEPVMYPAVRVWDVETSVELK